MSRYVVAKNDAAFHVLDRDAGALCFHGKACPTRFATFAEAQGQADMLNREYAAEVDRRPTERARGEVRAMFKLADAVERARFTPGPWSLGSVDDWEVDAPGSITYWHVLPKGANDPVAIATGHSESRMRANAHLISAAPDLFVALVAIMPENWADDDTMEHMPGIKLARLALAKALGVSP